MGGDAEVDPLKCRADPVLLALEHVEWDSIGIVCLHQLEPFAFQSAPLLHEPVKFLGLAGHESVELGVQHPGDVLAGLGGDLDGRVVLLDEAFHILDQHGLAGAVGVPGVPAGANEVGVDAEDASVGMEPQETDAAIETHTGGSVGGLHNDAWVLLVWTCTHLGSLARMHKTLLGRVGDCSSLLALFGIG